MVYLVGEVLVHVHQIQKKLWRIGNRDCMKCPQGNVLGLPCALRWIGTEVCDPPRYDRLTDVASFIREFELQISYQQRLLALDVTLKVTPTRWWVVHKDGIRDWQQCRRLLQVRFGTENEDTMQKYT
jgi:hypothetical protein